MRISRDFLRITGGKFRSQLIERVNIEETKETQDIVKLAIFNMLNNQINGSVLDLFAGSGAYGFEALSRGALNITLNDSSKIAFKTINNNIKRLKIEDFSKSTNLDYKEFISLNKEEKYDFIFLDPPYQLINDYSSFFNLIKTISNKNTIIILESHLLTEIDTTQLNILKSRNFSKKTIRIFTFL